MRSGCNDLSPLKRIFDCADSPLLERDIIREKVCGIATYSTNELRRIGRTANAQEPRSGIMVQKCNEHLIDSRVRECAEQNRTRNSPDDFRYYFCLACSWRSPNQMENGTGDSPANGFHLGCIQGGQEGGQLVVGAGHGWGQPPELRGRGGCPHPCPAPTTKP